MSGKKLGEQLRSVRALRGASMNAIAKRAKISTAYLQKLERGDVSSPSPHILHKLADALDTPYEELMGAAGYVSPETPGKANRGTLGYAFRSEKLTPEEAKELANYLTYIRSKKKG